MEDYIFDSPDELLTALKECKKFGIEPLVVMNGEAYSLSDKFFEEKGETK